MLMRNIWDGLVYIVDEYEQENYTIYEFENEYNWHIVTRECIEDNFIAI